MSNNKQSSVECLQWALEHTILTHEQTMQTIGLFEQAKAMHRVEIIESYASGSNDRLRNTINTNYYNETFGGNND